MGFEFLFSFLPFKIYSHNLEPFSAGLLSSFSYSPGNCFVCFSSPHSRLCMSLLETSSSGFQGFKVLANIWGQVLRILGCECQENIFCWNSDTGNFYYKLWKPPDSLRKTDQCSMLWQALAMLRADGGKSFPWKVMPVSFLIQELRKDGRLRGK